MTMNSQIPFHMLTNTRDLGGMHTIDGRTIRPGKLIRSGQLYYADEDDRRKLEEQLDLIVDLRTEKEQSEKPDPILRGVQYCSLPALDTLAPGVTRDEQSMQEVMRRFLSDPENTRQTGYTLTEKEIEAKKEWILSRHYIEIGEYEGFTYILVTEDPESLKNAESSTGLEEEYLEEYIALLERAALLKKDIRLTGGVELRNPVVLAEEGSRIKFQAMDLDGNPAKSENLFAGHSLTMINLWATWCNPCIRELPELEKINQEYANKNCQVIGIVTDADNAELISKAKDILAEKGVTYINLAAFEGLSDLLPQEGWPTSYFVDEKGCLVGEPVAGARPNQYRERMEKSGEASD